MLIISLILNYLHLKIYCRNYTSNRSEKKLLLSSLTAASITLYFKTFYLVIMNFVMMKLKTKNRKKCAQKIIAAQEARAQANRVAVQSPTTDLLTPC
jgi:hypothetical protein